MVGLPGSTQHVVADARAGSLTISLPKPALNGVPLLWRVDIDKRVRTIREIGQRETMAPEPAVDLALAATQRFDQTGLEASLHEGENRLHARTIVSHRNLGIVAL